MHHDALTRCRIHSGDIIDWEFLARQGLDQSFFKSINKDPFSSLQWVNLFQISKNVYRELVHEFFASFEFDAYPYRYDPNHLGVRESATLSGLRKGVTVKANHLVLGFWPTIGDGGFIIRNTKMTAIRDPKVLTNEMGALSFEPSFHVFKKKSLISMGVVIELHNGACFWPTTQEVEEEYEEDDEANKAAGGDTNPHLQIDPFPRCEADYPPYGYIGHMPPGNEYRFGPTPGGFE
ncbi:hypothetical protein Tco_0336865 [Tanacetum coccineum]